MSGKINQRKFEDTADYVDENEFCTDRVWIAAAAIPSILPTHVSLSNRDTDLTFDWNSAFHKDKHQQHFIERC